MRPKKSLGQNFLNDDKVINNIVSALGLKPGDTAVEIGPGRGALTTKLIETGADVIAIEIDRQLVPALRTQFTFDANFRVIEADILETNLGDLLESRDAKTKLVGNLPYNISTAILQKLATERSLLQRAVLMFQREVIDRITARPGDSERGYLTVLAEGAFAIERLFDVAPEAFTPRPKVWSGVIGLEPRPPGPSDDAHFRKLVSAGFAQKRKTILNNLKSVVPSAGQVLESVGIDTKRRAETLTLAEWIALYEVAKGK